MWNLVQLNVSQVKVRAILLSIEKLLQQLNMFGQHMYVVVFIEYRVANQTDILSNIIEISSD